MTPASTRPAAKGWCPDGHRPMMSGDGLIIRVRPYFGRIDRTQAHVLAAITRAHSSKNASAEIEITSRGALQLRGLTEAAIPPIQARLIDCGLLDPDPVREAARSAVFAPFRRAMDYVVQEFYDRLDELPSMPPKFCFGFDLSGSNPSLRNIAIDLRIEACSKHGLIAFAGNEVLGADYGADTVSHMIKMAQWFDQTGGTGRMTSHLAEHPLPKAWHSTRHDLTTIPRALQSIPIADRYITYAQVPFGVISADQIEALFDVTQEVQFCAHRILSFAHDAPLDPALGLITSAAHPQSQLNACIGAPACSAASVETRALAAQLSGNIHVSGCAKGCAHPRPAPVTLVGRAGKFDLVRNGHPWDEPCELGLSAEDILSREELT